jgi:hypothetical protein
MRPCVILQNAPLEQFFHTNSNVYLHVYAVHSHMLQAEWDVDDVANCFEYYAKLAEELDAKQWHTVDVGDEVNFEKITPC